MKIEKTPQLLAIVMFILITLSCSKKDDEVILTGWRVGEIYFGGYSQLAKVNGDFLVKKPKNLTSKQAMILGTAGFTSLMSAFAIKAREELLEAVAEYDEDLLEKFFEDPNTITEDEIHEAIRKATIDISIIPMMCGSSFKNKGVQTALDAIVRYLPGPMDIEAVKGTNPDTGEEIFRHCDTKEPFSALAFKIMTDPFVGRLAFFRCYSGHLDAGSYVKNMRSGKNERISRIMKMFANKQNPIDFIEAGDIAAAVGFKEIKTGDTLSDVDKPIILILWEN